MSIRNKMYGLVRDHVGICSTLMAARGRKIITNYQVEDLRELMVQYLKVEGKFSDDMQYPIACEDVTPRRAYENSANLWDEATEYGRTRREVFEYLVRQLERAEETKRCSRGGV